MLKQFWILTKNVLLRILFKGNTFKNSDFKIIQYLIKVCKTETSFLYHVHDFASELAPCNQYKADLFSDVHIWETCQMTQERSIYC